MKRRAWLGSIPALGVLAARARAAADAQTLTKLVASYGSIEGSQTPLWVAFEAGYFRAAGLDVELVYQASSTQVPALLSGDVQIAQVGGPEVASVNLSGADLVILATLGAVFPYQFMVAADIKTPAQLRGKTIGVSRFGDVSDAATRIALRRVGVDPKEVSFVQVGSSVNRTAALIGGTIQGGVQSPPATFLLQAHGLHPLFDLAALKIAAATATVAARRSWVAAHHDLVQSFIDALLQGVRRERTDENFTVGVMKKYFKSEDDREMHLSWNYFAKQVVPAVPYPRVEQFTASLAEMATGNEKLAGYDVSKMLDDSFLHSASARLRIR